MKNKLLTPIVLILWTSLSFSQAISINTDNSAPDATAILDVKSTTKGMLIPRMLTSQREVIGSGTPATGLLVYDLTSESFWFYNGTAWVELIGGYVSELRDADNDTKVQVEESPDEDKIRFDLGGQEKMVLQRNVNNVVRLDIKDTGANTFVGENAGFNSSGGFNSAIGFHALYTNSTGSYNTASGYGSLQLNASGSDNTAVGHHALLQNVDNHRSTAIGKNAMENADNRTIGRVTYNTAVGYEALKGGNIPASNTGQYNTAIGDQALYSNTTGFRNVAVGNRSLYSNTTGFFNTALGQESLYSNKANSLNTAVGYRAMHFAHDGTSDVLTRNTAVGSEALRGSTTPANNTGQWNTAIGAEALFLNSTGSYNVAIGSLALNSNAEGVNNIAIGAGALFVNTFGAYNTGVGTNVLLGNTTGNENVAMGLAALASNKGNHRSTAIGQRAMYRADDRIADGRATYNTAVGYEALHGSPIASNNIGQFNTAIGDRALFSNTSGVNNTAIGAAALSSNTTGTYNTAIGDSSLLSNITGSYNTSTGVYSLSSNIYGWYNTANGVSALYSNTFGASNTANGAHALYYNTEGHRNSAYGRSSLQDNTTGSENTAIGAEALVTNKANSRSTAVGYNAMRYADNRIWEGRETYNTAVGCDAMRGGVATENNTGRYNTAIGDRSLFSNSSGSFNTANGYHALYSNTSGSNNYAGGINALHTNLSGVNNTAIGEGALYFALYSSNTAVGASSGTDSDSSSNCTYIGRDADNDFYTNSYFNSTALGNGARMTASNQVTIGNMSIGSIGGYEPWTDFSDGRFKKDVQENVPGLSFIKKLRPVTYHLDANGLALRLNEDVIDARGDQSLNMPSQATQDARNIKAGILRTGFIAQEVEAVAQEMGYEFSGVDAPQNETDHYGLRYSQFVVPLVKAVQEQQTQIEEFKREIEVLQEENAQLKAANDHRWLEQQEQNNTLQAMIDELKLK